MSTKIHHGYRFRPGSTRALFARLHGFQVGAMEIGRMLMTRAVARRAVQILDARAVGLEAADEDSPLSKTWWEITERQLRVEREKRRDPEIDFECSLCLYFDGGYVYAMLFAEHDEYIKLWESQPGVEPFFYWNNTDRPKNVPEREWSNRKRVWNRISDRTPSVHAPMRFVAVETRGAFRPDNDNLLLHVPDFDGRVAWMAKQLALASGQGPQVDQKAGGFGPLLKWLESDDFRALRDEGAAKARAALKRELTLDDLMTDLSAAKPSVV